MYPATIHCICPGVASSASRIAGSAVLTMVASATSSTMAMMTVKNAKVRRPSLIAVTALRQREWRRVHSCVRKASN